MKKRNRTILLSAAAVAAVLVVVGGAYAAKLILPGHPSSGEIATFEGFVPLPKAGGALSILDYMLIDGKSLYVTSESAGDVHRIALHGADLPTASDIETFSLPAPTPAAHGVAVDPVSHLVYVTRSEANTVDIFDPNTRQVVKRIPVTDDCDAIFYDPTSKLIYVASGDGQTATLIDPATQAITGTIPLGAKAEYAALDPREKLLYQNLQTANAVAAVDLSKKAIVQQWKLDDCDLPTPMAIDEGNRRLFIGCGGNAKLKVFDLGAHKITASVDIGANPDSIVYDAATRRIFTTGKAGTLTIIEQDTPDTYRVVDSISTHYGAHTLAYDAIASTLFVAYAGMLVSPRLAMFTVKPRS